MVEFGEVTGPFAVTCRGEGWMCQIMQTPEDVLWFLLNNDGGIGLSETETKEDVVLYLQDDDNWIMDDGGEPFEWSFDLGEIGRVTVTRITV